MALIVQITGAPASGKTTSTKTLNPKETFYCDCDSKGLSWAGWRNDYNAANKNYVKESSMDKIKSYIAGIIKTRPDIKIILVDTITTILTDYLQAERKSKTYDKWKDVAEDAYELYSFCNKLVPPNGIDDVVIVFLAHSEAYKSVDPNTGLETMALRTGWPSKAATKQQLSKFLNYNLYTVVDNEAEPEERFRFRTQTTGADEARSTMGVLPFFMPNDLNLVIQLIRKYDLCIPPAVALVTNTPII